MKLVNEPDVLMRPAEVAAIFDVHTKTVCTWADAEISRWSGPWAGIDATCGRKSWPCGTRRSRSGAGRAEPVNHESAPCTRWHVFVRGPLEGTEAHVRVLRGTDHRALIARIAWTDTLDRATGQLHTR